LQLRRQCRIRIGDEANPEARFPRLFQGDKVFRNEIWLCLACHALFEVGAYGSGGVQQFETQASQDWAALLEPDAKLRDIARESEGSIAELMFINHVARLCTSHAERAGANLY